MSLVIRPMTDADVPGAMAIYKAAFAAFLKIPPEKLGDVDFVGQRYRSNPAAALAADYEGQLVGTHFMANWGSVAVMGPSTIKPGGPWTGRAGKLLGEAGFALTEPWGTTLTGVFTFAEGTRHIDYLQGWDFWPRFLTRIMSTAVVKSPKPPSPAVSRFSALDEAGRGEALTACRALAEKLYPGLDLSHEIRAVQKLQLGDTLLVRDGSKLQAFAVCHWGPGTEGGTGGLHIKFGAVDPDVDGASTLGQVFDAANALAHGLGLKRLVAGVNTGRTEAYKFMTRRGFLTTSQGIALHRPNHAGYSRAEVWALDDWR